MPSPTPPKYKRSVIRQSSLQNNIPLESPHSKLKKQLSLDDSKGLETVEVTGQKWTAADKIDSLLRSSLLESKIKGRVGINRHKAVKVAWVEKKQNSTDTPEVSGVEVIATKCHGQPRPLSMKTQRFRNPLLGHKDTLVYNRLQLAERLRNAWSEREKTKSNLNIFLAHASNAVACDASLLEKQTDNVSVVSDPPILDKVKKPMLVKAFSEDYSSEDRIQAKLEIPFYGLRLQGGYFKESIKHKCVEENAEDKSNKNSDTSTEAAETEEGKNTQELNKLEIKLNKLEELLGDGLENEIEHVTKQGEKLKKSEEDKKIEKISQSSSMTAQDRRAHFLRTSNILNKTINESFSSLSKEEDKKTVGDEIRKSNPKKPLLRALSAPISDPKPTSHKTVKFLPQKKTQQTPAVGPTADEIIAMRERIKSAPIRRKLKTAAARRKKDKEELSSSDEGETNPKGKTSTAAKKAIRQGKGKTGNDIITMVSLVSPAGSDTEDSVINLPLESLPVEEKMETTNTKPLTQESTKPASPAFVVPNFVALRKATKSVSFEPSTFSRNYSTIFPSRRVPAGTPIIVPTPIITNPALTPSQIQERDKRPPFTIWSDGGRGVKRRLMRSPSEPSKEETIFVDALKPSSESTTSGNHPETSDSQNEKEEDEKSEPDFKCPKEKECWDLYKKMMERGVTVSFDTVLRGMLTPTEYRLRKNR